MDLKAVMQKYGEELGIPTGIPSNGEGVYELPITDELTILARKTEAGSELFCNLGPFPMDREKEFLHELMTANLLGISTRGATLGLSAEGQQITLSQEWPEDLSYPYFLEGFEDFCDIAETWHNSAKGR